MAARAGWSARGETETEQQPAPRPIRETAAIECHGAHLSPPRRFRSGSLILRRQMDGAADGLIGSAAANVVVHGFVDIGVGGLRGFGQQRGGRHDLPGLAIAALRHVFIGPGALHRMAAIGREAFDGGDLLPATPDIGMVQERMRLAINVDRTGAAERHAATEFRSRDAERIAQDPEQGHRGDTSTDCGLPFKVNWIAAIELLPGTSRVYR